VDAASLVTSLTVDAPNDVAEDLEQLPSRYHRDTVDFLRPWPGATALVDEVGALGLQVVLAASAPKDEPSIVRRLRGCALTATAG
jgi:hypothetical protein